MDINESTPTFAMSEDDFTRRCLMMASLISFDDWQGKQRDLLMEEAYDACMRIEAEVKNPRRV